MLTIGETTTNSFHLEINGIIRAAATPCLALLISVKLIIGSVKQSTLVVLSFQLILIIWGFLLSSFYGGEKYIDQDKIGYLFLSSIFLFAILEARDTNFSMTGYIFLVFFVSIATGGLTFNPYPELDLVMTPGEMRDYSQGVTSLFGAFALFLFSDLLKKFSILNLFLFLSCLIISVLGAARGDFVAVAILIFLISFMKDPKKTIFFSFLFLLLLILTIDFNELAESLLIIERFSQLGGGNLGMRDVFFANSAELILYSSNIFLGNGFNYFQIFYGYDYGSYPHNILLELVISFGLIGLMISILSLIGFIFNLRNLNDKKVIFLMFIYVILMKSGNLINFFALPIVLYLADREHINKDLYS